MAKQWHDQIRADMVQRVEQAIAAWQQVHDDVCAAEYLVRGLHRVTADLEPGAEVSISRVLRMGC